MALSDGVNPTGENRRRILRRFLARKNKKGAIKGTTEPRKIIWPERSGIQTHIAYIFCTVAVVNLSRSIWYLFWCSFVYPVYDFRVINFRFPWHTKWELLGGEYIWVDLNHPPKFYNALNWIANQIFYLCYAKCADDTALWRRKNFIYCETGGRLPTAQPETGRSSESSSSWWHG